MAKLRFEINGEKGRISFPTFTKATSSVLSLLDEIARAVPEHQSGTLVWYVDDLSANGSLAVEVHGLIRAKRKTKPMQPKDFSPVVAGSFVEGLENLEVHGTSPPYLSQAGLARMHRLLGLLDRNGARGFTAALPETERSIEVGKTAADNLNKLLPQRRIETGSVEGRIETITIHRAKKFVVYQALTNKAVICSIEDDTLFTRAQRALGRKVLVAGQVGINQKNEPISIKAERLRVFKDRDKLPRVADLTGSDPDLTGSLSTKEYLRSIRGG